MTLSQLRTFTAVADAGSVSAAAARLHVTQPAVSAAVRALEESVGCELIEPEGRGLRLTAAGEVFAGYARRVLGLLEQAQLAAQGGHDPSQGTLRVAAVTTASEHVLPRSLALFRQSFPDVDVILEVGNKQQVWTWLGEHTVDVALAGRPPDRLEGVAVRARRPNELVVVTAPGTVEDGAAALPALEGDTWLLREVGSGTRQTLEAMLTAAEIAPELLTLGSNGAVVAAAVAGLGVTLMSRAAVDRELSNGHLEVVDTPMTPLFRPWHVVTHDQTTPTTELFVDHLLDPDQPHPEPRFAES